jgi:hypothetical protein
MKTRKRALAILCSLILAGLASAQDVKKGSDGVYAHDRSKSGFQVPKDWKAEPAAPHQAGATSSLHLRRKGPDAEALVSWSPLNVKIEEAAAAEAALMAGIFGQAKAGKPEPVTAGDRAGFKITVDDGPSRNGKEAGVIYLFESGPDEKNRWKVKLRATFPKMTQAESAKAVEELLLKGFRWE